MSYHHQLNCIRLVPIFQGMSIEEIEVLEKVCHIRKFNKGEFVFREGDSSETLYIVGQGLVKITKISEDGKEQIVRLLFPGDFFGQSALLKTENHYANAITLDQSELCTIHKQDFLMAIRRNPDISFRYILALNERLHQADEWVSLLSLLDVEQRLASVLLLFSEKMNITGGTFTLPISKKVLATLIGTTPETISRKLVAFVNENIITMNGQREIQILNYEALKRKTK
ncbi:Crp/Fnr family transcriptional regulator [Bacillus luteolus]|uniref:Crp/Fnr family transcriptional regulator n=1 Tax=Litchfieldia luteola TaxID=682179 RepID=A0ABR9QGK6_9BACI|nr:Crp/Fnr family transcriptional regulator [Cytobacillus luteolus]MBE4907615.1 Crp/Fnr family transcriptional regulator [Cytobacillus luteolus]MBP1941066.1 CRP/FNR family transcriptional regulator [Cytobacillus luteolus]